MMEPLLILFDDRIARDWMPFALTRPVGELRFGMMTLRERSERALGLRTLGYLTSDHLTGFDEPGSPPVLQLDSLPAERDLLFMSSRTLLSWGGEPFEAPAESGPIATGGEICGWYTRAGSTLPPSDFFLAPDGDPIVELSPPGHLLDRPWRLIIGSGDQLTRDILANLPSRDLPDPGDGVHLIGDAPLIVDPSAVIEPGTVIDLSSGPVWIDADAHISALTRLAGPAFIGRGSKILGGKLADVSIGPVCRVHGEVETSVILGYSNKSHDGFLGHAYLGSWVNLGAMTTNSDLKNNYGSIRIWTPDGEVDTGERKLGCLIGDHVKTAIGTLLNTGTVVGAGANLFGTGMPPHYVPPFSWGTGPGAGEYDLERFLATAEVVMSRRDLELSSKQRALLEAAWLLGRGYT